VQPEYASWPVRDHEGAPVPPGFRYASDTNDWWLSVDEVREMSADVEAAVV